jgi:hypothetical protein
MRRSAVILVPLALVLGVAACGDDDDNGGDAASEDASSEDAATDDTASEDESSDDDSSGGDSDSEWCQLARDVQAQDDLFSDVDFTDPEAMRTAFENATEVLEDAADSAPEEIQDDVNTSLDAFRQYIEVLEEANFDITQIDTASFDEIGADAEEAGARIDAYNERVCGLADDDPVTTDAATEATDGAAATTLPVGGNLDEMLVQQFVAMGMTEEEAQCLVDSIDIQEFAANQDVTQLLEAFEECGIDPTTLSG